MLLLPWKGLDPGGREDWGFPTPGGSDAKAQAQTRKFFSISLNTLSVPVPRFTSAPAYGALAQSRCFGKHLTLEDCRARA